MSFYLIAETAFHHEGDKEYLIKLIDATSEAGVDSVKFQILIDLDEFMSTKHSSYEAAKGWLLSSDEWIEVLDYAVSRKLDIVAMPLDKKAFEIIKNYDIKYLEVHSVSFKDEALLACLEQTKAALIFGVGGRTKEEIATVVNRYRKRDLVLMVGYQSFPTEFKDSQISKVTALKEIYPECKIGYADHSAYDEEMAVKSSELAYVLGARVFEKHLTIDEGKERIDFQSAINIDKFAKIKSNLLKLSEVINEDDVFSLSDKEVTYRNRQKVPVSNKRLTAGTVITKEDLSLKMIDEECCIESLELIIGNVISRDIERDEAFLKGDLK